MVRFRFQAVRHAEDLASALEATKAQMALELEKCAAEAARVAEAHAQAQSVAEESTRRKQIREEMQGEHGEEMARLLRDRQKDIAAAVQEYKVLYAEEVRRRKAAHNRVMELQGNIRVFNRVRPVLQVRT